MLIDCAVLRPAQDLGSHPSAGQLQPSSCDERNCAGEVKCTTAGLFCSAHRIVTCWLQLATHLCQKHNYDFLQLPYSDILPLHHPNLPLTYCYYSGSIFSLTVNICLMRVLSPAASFAAPIFKSSHLPKVSPPWVGQLRPASWGERTCVKKVYYITLS